MKKIKLINFAENESHKIYNILGIKIKLKKPSNNNIYIMKKNGKLKKVKKIRNLNITFKGRNNSFIISETAKFNNIKAVMNGFDNQIIIRDKCDFWGEIYFDMCNYNRNKKIILEQGVTIINCEFHCWSEGSTIHIGEDCMFSGNVIVFNGDGHPIYDIETKEKINDGKFVDIGSHCWIGYGAHICKNVKIAPNNVIGAESLVCKSLEEQNCVIAGNPAKIVRKNIYWERTCE